METYGLERIKWSDFWGRMTWPEDPKQIEMVQFEDLDPLTFYPFCYYFYLQEKKNSYAILKPYISPEEERIAMAARDTNEQKLEHLLFMCVQCTFSNLC